MASVRVLFDETTIASRIGMLAREIAEALPADLTVVGLLKGSFVFVADLVRALGRLGMKPRIEFLRLSSYGCGRGSTGAVRLVGEIPAGLADRPVLLVDDIVDTGRSLAFAKALLTEHGAAQILTCTLIDKPSRREIALAADLVGFVVPDVFVVGYGIDYSERYRYLSYVGTID